MQRATLQVTAAGYHYLRGLLAVPVGALFILGALGNWRWGPFASNWVFLVIAGLLGGALLLVKRFYDTRYGRVTPSTRQQLRSAAATVLGVGIMLGGSFLLRSHAAWSLDLPVNPIAGCFGLMMLMYCAIVVRLRPHHAVIWGALALTGFLPLWNGADPANIGLVLCGAAAIANGAFDHRLLARTLRPPRDADVRP